MVAYIVRRIAAADRTEGLDREIVEHLLAGNFTHEEIAEALRFLATAVTGTPAASESPTVPAAAADLRPITDWERLRLAEDAEETWGDWAASGVLGPAEAEEILRRVAAAGPGCVDAATLRRLARSVAPPASTLALYLSDPGLVH